MTPGRPNRGYEYREQIGPDGEGATVLRYLAAHYTHGTEADWAARLAAGQVTVGEQVAGADRLLRKGDRLVWRRPPWVEPEAPLSFEVVYEDEDLLAVSKPGGLPTIPGGGFLEHTLLALVRARTPGADPMHRLGRGTSGLVLFARTPLARAGLQDAWRRHQVRKRYRALASGAVPAAPFTITASIGPVRHPLLGEVFAANPAGKAATSHVTLLEQRPAEALVDVVIETGRPHQIRIHLAWAGHPLVGDPLYVAGGVPAPGTTALPGDLGYHLHAASLALTHPRSGAELVLVSTPPPILRWREDPP